MQDQHDAVLAAHQATNRQFGDLQERLQLAQQHLTHAHATALAAQVSYDQVIAALAEWQPLDAAAEGERHSNRT